jgi:ABC-2 type transport system ATP-binding protein
MIEFRNLTHHAGDRLVLDQVSLCVGPGEALAWVDRSGGSCAAIARLVLGLERPWAGRVLVDGVNPGRDPVKARRRLVHIPQDVNLYPRLTGLENLAYLVAVAGETPDLNQLRVQMQSFGLEREIQDRTVSAYSGDMRQCLLMALARVRGVSSVLWEFPESTHESGWNNPQYEALNCLLRAGMAVLVLAPEGHPQDAIGIPRLHGSQGGNPLEPLWRTELCLSRGGGGLVKNVSELIFGGVRVPAASEGLAGNETDRRAAFAPRWLPAGKPHNSERTSPGTKNS